MFDGLLSQDVFFEGVMGPSKGDFLDKTFYWIKKTGNYGVINKIREEIVDGCNQKKNSFTYQGQAWSGEDLNVCNHTYLIKKGNLSKLRR